MLVVEIIFFGGFLYKKIEEGDVLIKVNGEMLIQFICLDDILDFSVGGIVKFLVLCGGDEVEVEVEVGDLYKIMFD